MGGWVLYNRFALDCCFHCTCIALYYHCIVIVLSLHCHFPLTALPLSSHYVTISLSLHYHFPLTALPLHYHCITISLLFATNTKIKRSKDIVEGRQSRIQLRSVQRHRGCKEAEKGAGNTYMKPHLHSNAKTECRTHSRIAVWYKQGTTRGDRKPTGFGSATHQLSHSPQHLFPNRRNGIAAP